MKNLCGFTVIAGSDTFAGRTDGGIVFPEERLTSFVADGTTLTPIVGYKNFGLSTEIFCNRFNVQPGDDVIVPNFQIAIRAALDAGLNVFVVPANGTRNPADNSFTCTVLQHVTDAPTFWFVAGFRPVSKIQRLLVKGPFPIVTRGTDRVFPPIQDGCIVTGQTVTHPPIEDGVDAVIVPNIPAAIDYFDRMGIAVLVTSTVGQDKKVDLLQVR